MAMSTALTPVGLDRNRDPTMISVAPNGSFSVPQNPTIDLTGDDDDDDEDMDEVDTSAVDERHAKRPRIGPGTCLVAIPPIRFTVPSQTLAYSRPSIITSRLHPLLHRTAKPSRLGTGSGPSSLPTLPLFSPTVNPRPPSPIPQRPRRTSTTLDHSPHPRRRAAEAMSAKSSTSPPRLPRRHSPPHHTTTTTTITTTCKFHNSPNISSTLHFTSLSFPLKFPLGLPSASAN